jgi:predicted nucleotidyltransferase
MRSLESVIENYVGKMRQDYGMIGTMVTGSYVAGNMGPNSDIDIFFIWNQVIRYTRNMLWNI